ncbi:SDR family oxidoreductase [Saprospiraceae bacterium]|jgi:butyryl-CoA dehydrogenase|nr:SDR family oxidoreductase [Bacteroidota bacterium]MDB4728320.1 SDR family oxidoreductase [Saprospiraceae bacterium]MDF1863477.1 SDR family NAD(P)-dependent oxidoreductase [Saprospiraceae bacterium]
MKNFNGKVAVITGAASGIGRALAIQLSTLGAKIVAVDFNKEALSETSSLIEKNGGEVFQKVMDVSKKELIYELAEDVLAKYSQVDLVINNAGVALGLISVEDVTYDELEWIIGINLWGVIYGTKAFLPHLKTRPEAAIINISSVFGLVGVYKQAPYCITKFGVRGFTEALRTELMDSKVLVMQVHPGGIKTNIAKNARHSHANKEIDKNFGAHFEKNARTTAEDAAKQIIKGIQKKNPRVRIGVDAVWIDRLSRFFPNWMLKKFAKMSRRYEEGGDLF